MSSTEAENPVVTKAADRVKSVFDNNDATFDATGSQAYKAMIAEFNRVMKPTATQEATTPAATPAPAPTGEAGTTKPTATDQGTIVATDIWNQLGVLDGPKESQDSIQGYAAVNWVSQIENGTYKIPGYDQGIFPIEAIEEAIKDPDGATPGEKLANQLSAQFVLANWGEFATNLNESQVGPDDSYIFAATTDPLPSFPQPPGWNFKEPADAPRPEWETIIARIENFGAPDS
jgi:hypothetical protein